jgi:hypothetical protein
LKWRNIPTNVATPVLVQPDSMCRVFLSAGEIDCVESVGESVVDAVDVTERGVGLSGQEIDGARVLDDYGGGGWLPAGSVVSPAAGYPASV